MIIQTLRNKESCSEKIRYRIDASFSQFPDIFPPLLQLAAHPLAPLLANHFAMRKRESKGGGTLYRIIEFYFKETENQKKEERIEYQIQAIRLGWMARLSVHVSLS